MGSDSPTTDVYNLIYHHLLEDDDVSAQVGERISGPFSEATGEEIREQIYPLIVVDFIGGSSTGLGALQNPIVHVYVYSRQSQGEATRIYDVVKKSLRSACLSRSGIDTRGWIRETEPMQTGHNSALHAYYARGVHRVTATGLRAP